MACCSAKGYHITQVVKAVGSGVNDGRPRFLRLLADSSISVTVVEHKERTTLLERQEQVAAGQARCGTLETSASQEVRKDEA
jgi:predicted site-specific integrase-resolvase